MNIQNDSTVDTLCKFVYLVSMENPRQENDENVPHAFG